MKSWVSSRRCVLIFLGILALSGLQAALTWALEAPPKRATFAVTNTLTVQVPDGTQQVRVWFAVPQNDAQSDIQNLTAEAPYPVRYTKDSQGNTIGYLEVHAPKDKQLVIREAFTL